MTGLSVPKQLRNPLAAAEGDKPDKSKVGARRYRIEYNFPVVIKCRFKNVIAHTGIPMNAKVKRSFTDFQSRCRQK